MVLPSTMNRNIDQLEMVESLEINPHIYGQRLYGKRGQNMQGKEDILFSKWCWEKLKAKAEGGDRG